MSKLPYTLNVVMVDYAKYTEAADYYQDRLVAGCVAESAKWQRLLDATVRVRMALSDLNNLIQATETN